MIHDNVELHNVAELRYQPHRGGYRLQRAPESVRTALNPGAQECLLQPDNAEIRYVASGPSSVTLSSQGLTRVSVFFGPFDSFQRAIVGREPQTVRIEPSEALDAIAGRHVAGLPFSPRVVRLVLGGPERDPVMLHGVEGADLRPPAADEVPSLRLLTYGTSITHGYFAEGPHLSYVGHAARRLGADLINLGVAGSAHCEPELADYMADRSDWHAASLGLSVNMQSFPMPEFRRRVQYLVDRVAGADAGRPVACITLYPYFRDFGWEPPGEYGGAPEEYRQSLRDAVAATGHANAHLVEGPELLTDISGLSADLIHPGDYGMLEIGQRLADRLSGLLTRQAN